ncbi:MAG TPA: inositol monophosphatase [bacterium]|nr:inositol monophosphatase [bacterium]
MLEIAKQAAREAGGILMDAFGRLVSDQVDLKGSGDYVTDLDKRSEAIIIRRIRGVYPDHVIQAEESGWGEGGASVRWIIDPLDGTANYVQSIPVFAVSIAAVENNELRVGVIFDPVHDELFWAEKGMGAFLNGRPIHVSGKKELAYSMLASGFPWRSKEYVKPYLACFRELFMDAAGIRRMGAAAIDLAYTACGRFDGFWEMKLHAWDIAAGILIIEEAGGRVTDFHGGRDFLNTGNVVAGNIHIQPKILKIVRNHLSKTGSEEE